MVLLQNINQQHLQTVEEDVNVEDKSEIFTQIENNKGIIEQDLIDGAELDKQDKEYRKKHRTGFLQLSLKEKEQRNGAKTLSKS